MTYSAAELLDFNKDAFENALNKYQFIKSEELLMVFKNMFDGFEETWSLFNIQIEYVDIDFLYGNRGAEPVVVVPDEYIGYKEYEKIIKDIIKITIDMLFTQYEQETTADKFIEYATFEGLEFDEVGNWVEGDDDESDDYYKYW